jgi:hypothetical protein
LRLSKASLRQLSEESGGFAAVNRNDTSTVFDRIVQDNSAYYVLAYYPAASSTDGKFHKIEVKVNHPGITVRARRGYTAPTRPPASTTSVKSGDGGKELDEAMKSVLPMSGLGMRLFAAPLKGSKKTASVVVGIELNGRNLTLGPNNRVELSFAAVDRRSKVFGARRDTLPLNMDFETRARVEQGAIRVVNRVSLPPGRYRLHAAALDPQQHLVGSVVSDIEVPDFYKEPFTMSGVMVTSRAGANMVTALADEQLRTLLPSPVIALRTFSQDDELDVFAEVYDNSAKTPHQIDVVATVFTRDGQQVGQTTQKLEATQKKIEDPGVRYREYLPMSRLLPGEYVLKIEARSGQTTKTQASRNVAFSVREAVPPAER